jgi:alpha-1,2-mannosyltransferase
VDTLVAAAWLTLALDNLWLVRREEPVRATLGPALTGGWRPPRSIQAAILAATLAAAAVLESRTGRGSAGPGSALIGLALVVGGLVLHLRARRALGPFWSGVVEVRAGQPVVTRGPYAAVRHPLYLALLLLGAGSFLAHPSVAAGCLAGGLAVGLGTKIQIEERALRTALGAAYTDYATRVPALVPDVGPALTAVGRFVGTRRRRYALFLGAALWGGWLLSLLVGPGLLDLTGHVKGADFIEFYAAGRIVGSGQADHLYDLALQQRVEHEITAPEDWPGLHGFLNPPFFALPFVLFAHLPYLFAFALWSLLGLALLLAALVLVAHKRAARALPWVLAFVPVFAAVSYGQNTLLSLFLLALAFALLRRGRDLGAGVLLGCLLYKPQLVVVLALTLLADRRWRACFGLGAAGACLATISWVMSPAGARSYVAFSRSFPTMLMDPGFPTWNMHSLHSFFVLLLPDLHAAAQALAVLASLGALAATRARQPRYGPDGLARWFAAALWGTTLASPHVFLYDLSPLALAGVLLWPEREEEDLWIGGAAVLWVAVLFSGPLTRVWVATMGAGVQVSVPVIAVVGYRLLRDGAPRPGITGLGTSPVLAASTPASPGPAG